MDVLVHSPGVDLNIRTEAAIQDRFEKLGHLQPGVIRCDVLLTRETRKPGACSVQAKLIVRGFDLFAKEHGTTFIHATRLVCADLENQIRKRREQRSRHQPAAPQAEE